MSRLIGLIIMIIISTTGCWDAKDVKDLTIPTLQGFDYQREAGKYVSYMSYPVFVNNQKKSAVLRTEGHTIGEIDTQHSNQSERVISLGDLKGFVLGKEFAMYGTELLDVLFRNPMLSLTQQMAVVDGDVEEIFKVQPYHSESIGTYFVEMFRNAQKNDFIPDETVYNFMVNTNTSGFNPVLPVISAQKDNIKITGAALFKKNKMVAIINDQDMRVLTWLRGEKKYGNISFELTDEQGKQNKLTFKGSNKRKVKAWLENDMPVFEVEIKLEGVIMEVLGNYRFAGEEHHVELAQKALEEKVKRQCERFVQDLQNEYQVDAILLGKYARMYWPEKVQQQDWDKNFCNSIVNVKVQAVIYASGERA